MFESIHGLTPSRAAHLTALVEECLPLLSGDDGMELVQERLRERGAGVLEAILVTRELLGVEEVSLGAAKEIVLTSPARTAEFGRQLHLAETIEDSDDGSASWAGAAVSTAGDDQLMLVATNEAGLRVRKPSKPAMSTMVANLRRGNAFLIVERVSEESDANRYVQVWLRDDNTYQLEYRDGSAAEHYRTRTISQEKAITAVLGWASGDPSWTDAFMWNNIGSQFSGESQQSAD
ncbi:hypothetical protein [Kitasatospora sp. NPDC088134]|uniref:hypothetical protein n=1 Tax=Kitasatospora sp. NPDC088134 TaxID=3364071 RepID=UPI00382E8F54